MSKKKIAGIIVACIIGIIIVIAIATSGGETSAPDTTPAPSVDFTTQTVTETSVRNAIKDLSGTGVALKGNITQIEVLDDLGTPDSNDKIIHVYYKPEVWDEKDAMSRAVHTAIATMKTLFRNDKVGEVVMWQQGEFSDKYGKATTETAVRIMMDKEIADKIVDWGKVDERAWADYSTFFDLAELQYVHPAIGRAL